MLDPACLMAFPGLGVMRAADVLESLTQAPRWASVTMTDRSVGRAGDAVLVLGYTAEGKRDGAGPYRCFCTSTYRADDGRWTLVQHQQTMAD
nr:nuclear transport factor 2 family protein [Paracraurococcus ruber]